MRSLFFCVLILLVSTYGEAYPQPDASTNHNNNPGNRYDEIKSAEADSINEFAPEQSVKSSDTSAETGPDPDSEVESVIVVGNSENYDNSDDSFEEYDHFFPSLKGNDDLEKYFSDFFINIEQSLREFQNYGNQFMTDPFKDQNSYFNMYPNSAYALAAAGPDRTHQIAAISPANPAHGLLTSKRDEISSAMSTTAPPTPVNPWFPSLPFMPNFNSFFNTANDLNSYKEAASSSFVFPSSWSDSYSYNQPNINTFSDRFGSDTGVSSGSGKPHYTAVSSFSSSSSVNVNGHNVNHKTAETVVNRDGKVTKYRVQD